MNMAAFLDNHEKNEALTASAHGLLEPIEVPCELGRSLIYRSLSTDRLEIRTLVLLPGTGVVQCRLEHIFLDEPHSPYYAVSYTWGERVLRENIIVNEVDVMVPEEQWAVLSTLRDYHMTGSHLRLWMDFICINQASNIERGHQVSIMGKIFNAAHTVFCWLGGATSDTATQLATYNSPHHDVDQQQTLEAEQQEMVNLFKSPYWDRVWIVQEFLQAREIQFFRGQYTFIWKNMNLQSPWWDVSRVNGPFHRLIQGRQHEHGSFISELVDLVRFFGSLGCSDPHDRIYALLSLAQEEDRKLIHIDYSRTILEVFVDLALRMQHSKYAVKERNGILHIIFLVLANAIMRDELSKFETPLDQFSGTIEWLGTVRSVKLASQIESTEVSTYQGRIEHLNIITISQREDKAHDDDTSLEEPGITLACSIFMQSIKDGDQCYTFKGGSTRMLVVRETQHRNFQIVARAFANPFPPHAQPMFPAGVPRFKNPVPEVISSAAEGLMPGVRFEIISQVFDNRGRSVVPSQLIVRMNVAAWLEFYVHSLPQHIPSYWKLRLGEQEAS
jgi:hypothetical protein